MSALTEFLPELVAAASLSLQWLVYNKFVRHQRMGGKQSLRLLTRLVDLLPPPRLRKRIRKLLADQQHHIAELRKSKRHRAAAWIVFTTWVLVFWYIVVAPVSAVISVALGKTRGAGE
jgi:hypothetical protein